MFINKPHFGVFMKDWKGLVLAGAFSVAAHLGLVTGLQYYGAFDSPPLVVQQAGLDGSDEASGVSERDSLADEKQPSAFSIPSHLRVEEADAAAFLFPKPLPLPPAPLELPKEDVPLYEPQALPRAEPIAADFSTMKIERPLEKILSHPSEPSTLPALYAARAQFQRELFEDMTDDPFGELKLTRMPFIDFFVRSWYYKYAIEELEEGRPVVHRPERLYQKFDRMLALARSRIEPDDSPLERSVKFHAAMFSFLRGYERDTRDMYSALDHGVINCDSGTRLGLSGYTLFDPHAGVNLFIDHSQSATMDDGKGLTIENTTPLKPVGVRQKGLLVKPEVYAVGYLLLQGDASVSDFPEEVQGWYGYPFPNFLGLYDPFFFGAPIPTEFSGIKKPDAGFRRFDRRPAFDNSTVYAENASRDLTQAGSGISQTVDDDPQQQGWEEVRTPLEEQIERIQRLQEAYRMIDMEKLRASIQGSVRFKLEPVKEAITSADSTFTFHEDKTQFEKMEVYAPQGQLPQPQPRKFPEVQVLSVEVRDAEVGTRKIGLLQNLPVRGVSYITLPSVDWCQLAKELIDNNVVLYGTDSYQRWKGIQQRQLAVQRALAFGQGCQGLGTVLEKRMDIIIEAINSGKPVAKSDLSLFQGYGKWISPEDSPVGLITAVLEDMVSFRGEEKAIDVAMKYLHFPSVTLDRIGYGQLLVALQYRLTAEGVTSLCSSLERNLVNKKIPLEGRVGMAQFMHRSCGVRGNTVNKVAGVLHDYLQTRDDWRREEVLQLLETGLPWLLAASYFEKSLDHRIENLTPSGELWKEYALFDEQLDQRGYRDEDKVMWSKIIEEWRGLVEDYEILAALGTSSGYSLVRGQYFAPRSTTESPPDLLPRDDLAKLLVRHGQAVEEIIAAYWKKENEVPFTFVTLMNILVSEGQAARAEKMLEDVVAGDYEFRNRLAAAAGLYALGETAAGSKAMTDIVVEGCSSRFETDRTLQASVDIIEGRTTKDSIYSHDWWGRSLFIPVSFLARLGITPEDQQRLVKAGREGKLCLPDYFEDDPSVSLPFLDHSFSPVGLAGAAFHDLLPHAIYREEFLVAAQEYVRGLQQLGMIDPLLEAAVTNRSMEIYRGLKKLPALLAGLSHPRHRETRERAYAEDDAYALITAWSYFPRFEAQDIEKLENCSKSLIANDCEALLILRGYLGLDEFGLPKMYNPPKPIPEGQGETKRPPIERNSLYREEVPLPQNDFFSEDLELEKKP